MTVIEFAEKRLNECEEHEAAYWAAYLDGAIAQEKEDEYTIKHLWGLIDAFREAFKKRSEAE